MMQLPGSNLWQFIAVNIFIVKSCNILKCINFFSQKELKTANIKWEYQCAEELKKAKEKTQQAEKEELLTYTRQDAFNMVTPRDLQVPAFQKICVLQL